MTKKEPVAHGKMTLKQGSPPGLETDGHANAIPFEKRTKEDQDKARNASHSVKKP